MAEEKRLHLRWKNHNLRRKREKFKVIHEDVKANGFRVPVFDYFSYEPYKEVMDAFMQHCRYMGMDKKTIIKKWNKTTGMFHKDIHKVIDGHKMIEAWEMFMLFNAVGLKLKVGFLSEENPKTSRFATDVQSSSIGTKLVIRGYGFIQFALVMNLDDYNDWEVTFKTGMVAPSIDKYRNEVLEGLKHYFLKEARKRSYPFDIRVF